MICKKSFIPIFFIFSCFVFAQNADESDEILFESEITKENAQENKILQPFEWTSAGEVLKYEIIIEQFDKASQKYVKCYSHETNEEENKSCRIFIEPPLPRGEYRSTIKVYNVLGVLEKDMTSTDVFIVRPAYKPDIRDVSYPLYMRSMIYLDDYDNDGVIEVEGRNLFGPNDAITDYFLVSEKRTIKPDTVTAQDSKNRKVRLKFNMKKIDVGIYHLYAQDSSGLHSEYNSDSEFIVKFKKWMDLDIEAGYVCPIALHDDTFPFYLEKRLYTMSAQSRITFIPYKRNWGYLGIGLRACATRFSTKKELYTIDGNLGMGHVLFVYQKPTFRRRLFIELHGGAGLTCFNNIQFHYPHNVHSDLLNTCSFSFDAGGSLLLFLNKRIYAEASADYILTKNKDMLLGFLMPSAGIGWQF